MSIRKIIHIYTRSYDSYFPSKESDYYYLAGWSSMVARQTVKYESKYIIKIWRPEKENEEPVARLIQRIQCRLFPVTNIPYYDDFSLEMLKEIARQKKA